MSSSLGSTAFLIFAVLSVATLKELNIQVNEPYMDEPFHVPQLCFDRPTQKDFCLQMQTPNSSADPLLTLLLLPLATTRLLRYHQRMRPPPSLLTPTLDSVVLSTFPVAWFFGFLYYTDVPSLLSVILTILGIISCTFRQTNIIWLLYAYASSQLTHLRFRRAPPGGSKPARLHDPPALAAGPLDLVRSILSAPMILPDLLPPFIPYALTLALFGGIVLGDKSNHVASFHLPQLYYFIAFATIMGWPALVSGDSGWKALANDVQYRIFGNKRRTMMHVAISVAMGLSIKLFTIHHPFLLSDNRHYTFYVWKRIFSLHPIVPYLLIPGYIVCAWIWFLRVASLLFDTLRVMRAQLVDVTTWGLLLEGVWYGLINAGTMYGVGRFMW
ncbi:DIE2/ALG10 family-domain-containing protein [Russula vinacea]|nr:DIE2/ALG10 family-domain-containing protein [Russula vinacea]